MNFGFHNVVIEVSNYSSFLYGKSEICFLIMFIYKKTQSLILKKEIITLFVKKKKKSYYKINLGEWSKIALNLGQISCL